MKNIREFFIEKSGQLEYNPQKVNPKPERFKINKNNRARSRIKKKKMSTRLATKKNIVNPTFRSV